MAREVRPIPAICLPALGQAELEPRDGTSTGSSYTEVGPRPGVAEPEDPRSRAVPVVASQQGRDYELRCVVAGSPRAALGRSAQLVYRAPGEDDDSWRGWSPPGRLVGWSPLDWSEDSPAAARVSLATVPVSQRVVAVSFGEEGWESRRWDPQAIEWEDPVAITVPEMSAAMYGQTTHGVLLALATGRLLFLTQSAVYRSDDEAASWELHALGVHDVGAPLSSPDTTVGAVGAAGEIVLIEENGTDWAQRVSYDQLGTTQQVAEDATLGTSPTIASLPGGGFVVAYCRASDGELCVRRIVSGSESVFDATEIQIETILTTRTSSQVLVAEPDGLLWLIVGEGYGSGSVFWHMTVWGSDDGGLTWAQFGTHTLRSPEQTADEIHPLAATVATGIVHVAHAAGGSGAYADSLGVLRLGGWDNRPTAGSDGSTIVSDRPASCGSGPDATWVPTHLPPTVGWDATGTGTASFGSAGRLQIETASDNRWFGHTTTADTQLACAAFEVSVIEGGDDASNVIAARLRAGSATGDTWGADVSVRLTDAGDVVVWDEVGGLEVARLTDPDLWDDPIQVRVWLSYSASTGPVVSCEYRTVDSEGLWLVLCAADPVSDNGTPVDDSGIAWGHLATGTATSRWQWVHFWTHFAPEVDLDAGEFLSRPLSDRTVPARHGTGPSIAAGPMRLGLTGGAAHLGETWSVPAAYDYPIEALDPTLSPSPERGWRAESADAVTLAYDLGERGHLGSAVGLLVHRASFRLAVLEYYEGSAWVEAATADLAVGTGLAWELRGDTLTAASGSAEADRYLQEGELVGGHAILAGGVARRIVAQSAGSWGGPGRQAVLRLELQGGEASSGSACTLVAPSGVLVWYPTEEQVRRRWRVRIPAQDCPDEGFRCGVLSVLSVRAIGAPTDWGWSRERRPSVDVRRSRSGTTRAVRLGRAPRSYTATWATSGVVQGDLRRASPGSRWVSPIAGGVPLAACEDVSWLLDGLLEETNSGAVPVVWLPVLPVPEDGEDAATVTDPTLWLYGRWVTPARADHQSGDELDAVERPAVLTVEELV